MKNENNSGRWCSYVGRSSLLNEETGRTRNIKCPDGVGKTGRMTCQNGKDEPGKFKQRNEWYFPGMRRNFKFCGEVFDYVAANWTCVEASSLRGRISWRGSSSTICSISMLLLHTKNNMKDEIACRARGTLHVYRRRSGEKRKVKQEDVLAKKET